MPSLLCTYILPSLLILIIIIIKSIFVCDRYGLLGPSGCGKSTLLQCIMGSMELDSGCIDLKATHLKDVGYMPQVNIEIGGLIFIDFNI